MSDSAKWYVVHTYSGYENAVKTSIEKFVNGRGMGDMEGKVVSLDTIKALASIPALPVLQAQVLGTMLAPITGLAVVLKQIAEKQGASAEEAAAPAPAAE